MPLVSSRTDLSQGSSLSVASAIWATGTGADIRIHTSAANNLPALAANEFFEVRDHTNSQNNGLYQVVTVTTSTDDYECDKVSGSAPATAGAETVTVLGATGASTEKSVHFDVSAREIYILEQGNVDSAGVTGQAIYSFTVQEWKDDAFIIGAAPFPMLAIDADAGKYVVGQDPSGNNNGWTWRDNASFSIRTRKLLRNMGWNEQGSTGDLLSRYVGVTTLGAFEDPTNDVAYYQFGTDTTVDDTVDFDFAGPVNEAVQFYNLIGDLSGDTPAFGTTSTITRATGSFITDGFKVGGQVTVIGSTSNDGTYVLTGVAALTLTVTGTPLTVEAWGTSTIAVNNDNVLTLRLRVRDADPNGKTFSQANIGSAGRTVLSNFVYAFPLANATDLDISVADTGIDADSNGAPDVSPYSGMTITYHASGQARAGLVGGSFNFGIIIEGNNGTASEVYEFIQWSLRSTGGFGTGDIDNDADTAIGRAMDGLMRFVGPELQVGSTDGGLSFPTNPDGGGSGVFIDNLNATSANDVIFYDNTGVSRAFPETIAITLDFNQTLIDDTVAEYDLFYDRTIRTTVSDLVITAVSGATGTITSAGTNMPNNAELSVNDYIRVSGLTGADSAMNGIYQITAETTPGANWSVIRWDSATVVTTSSASAEVDQNPIDSPDAIIVNTNVVITATTISFTNPDTIDDSGSGFGIFTSGDIIRIEGTASNDGIYEVDTAAAGQLTTIEQTLTTEAAGGSFTITKIVSGIANSDFTFSYDFDNNVQGGRTGGSTTSVKAKAVGAQTAQPTESTVQSIVSGTPLTIPLVSNVERNYA